MATWQFQDAKNRFSAVVNAALDGEPQRVTRRGQPAVVVLTAEEYERLRELDEKRASSFADLLLQMPQAPDDDTFELPTRTRDFRPREVDF